MYNNLSQDHYLEVLTPYVEEGVVELIDWPYEAIDEMHWKQIQCSSYNDCFKRARGLTKWLAFIDTDEFLFSPTDKYIVDILNEFKNYGGVCVNWQIFGTSWVKRVPEDRLMIEMLTRKANKDHRRNFLIKSIVRPDSVKYFDSVHHAKYLDGFWAVNTDHQRIKGSKTKSVLIDRLRLNHYWTRDEDFLIEVKAKRRDKPLSDYQAYINDLEIFNKYEDLEILKHTDALKFRMESATVTK